MQSRPSGQMGINQVRLGINGRKLAEKYQTIWNLNNTFLNNLLVMEGFQEQFK
jgi:hypothetical protein